jgi:hypothetical protein
LKLIEYAKSVGQEPRMTVPLPAILDAMLQSTFELGRDCGRSGRCLKGRNPFAARMQASLRAAWINWFTVGGIESAPDERDA